MEGDVGTAGLAASSTHTHTFHFLPFPFHLSDKSISALCDYLMTCVPSALPALKQDFAPCLKSDLHSLHTHTHRGKGFLPSLKGSASTATATTYKIWNPLHVSLHCPSSSRGAQGWVNPSGMPTAAFPQLTVLTQNS